MSELQSWARALGGEVSGDQVLCPGPGHSAKDRSLAVMPTPDGIVVHSFAGDDPIECKDFVRDMLGLEPFKPNGKDHAKSVQIDHAPYDPKPRLDPMTEEEFDAGIEQQIAEAVEIRVAKIIAAKANGEAEPLPASPKQFVLIPFDAIRFDGAEEWLVKGLLPRVGVGAFFGAKSAFKSFGAQDVGMHVACGWNWAGRGVKQVPVVYIAAEGAGGFRKRKAGFDLRHAEHLPETVPFHLISVAPNLGQGTADREALVADVKGAGVSPGLIIIDTVAQTLGSGEENGAGMIQLIANAMALSEKFSCFVLLVHHAGLTETERLRGHSSLGCALDALVFFEAKEGALAARLTVQKLKEEADRDVALDMELVRVVIAKDCDGDEISTLVVDSVRDGDKAVRAARGKPASQAKMVCDEFVTVYDFLADGKPQLVGLDGRSRVLKVPVKDIREELRNRGFLECDEKGNLERVSRTHFSRAKNQLLTHEIFIERGGLIWRKGVANLYEKTDG